MSTPCEACEGAAITCGNYTSVDGVGTLAANFRARDAPLAWNDVDMSWKLDRTADETSPLSGKVHQDDEKRIFGGLISALEQVGSSYTDKHKRDKSGRKMRPSARKQAACLLHVRDLLPLPPPLVRSHGGLEIDA